VALLAIGNIGCHWRHWVPLAALGATGGLSASAATKLPMHPLLTVATAPSRKKAPTSQTSSTTAIRQDGEDNFVALLPLTYLWYSHMGTYLLLCEVFHMRSRRHSLHPVAVALSLGSFLFFSNSITPKALAQSEAVDELQQLLKQGGTLYQPTQQVLDFRKEQLSKAAARLETPSDLRLALELTDWKDTRSATLDATDLKSFDFQLPPRKSSSTFDNPPEVRRVDQEVRAGIGKRLENIINEAVDNGNSYSRSAAANLLYEIGSSIRGLPLDDKNGFAHGLAPSLVKLTQQNEPGVRQTAAKALGKTNPPPQLAVQALQEMLKNKDVNDRRAAAEALAGMIRVVYQAYKKGSVQVGISPNDVDVVACAEAVVPVAGACIRDGDGEVRAMGLDALVQAAGALSQLVPDTTAGQALDRNSMPPSGRPWTPAEKETVKNALSFLEGKEQLLAPLISALKEQGGAIAKSLGDSNDQARFRSRKALEMLANARIRLNRARQAIPMEQESASQRVVHDDLLKDAIQPGLIEIAKWVRDPRVAVRQATVEFLDAMEDAAAPAIPVLVAALGDKNKWVRMAAARTLGKIGPIQPELTVPALAKLMIPEEDVDVRKEAALTLRSYGPAAKKGLVPLIAMLGVGEAEGQEAVLKAIKAVGGRDMQPAIPALITSLESNSPNVRKLAAEALGRLGPLAQKALPKLNERLRIEEDSNVKMAICDAILAITTPQKV
jgi:HEAT repeat protein